MSREGKIKRPAFQFYPGDHLRDTALRSCSIAARGAWVDMLCLMHEGTPYGHLSAGGKAISTARLARMIGATLAEAKRLVGELEEAGVFSRTEDGTIYSRRMLRDEHNRTVRAAGGILSVNHPNTQKPKGWPKGWVEGSAEGCPEGYPSGVPFHPPPASASASAVNSFSDDAAHHPADAAQDEPRGPGGASGQHTRNSVLGVVIERLYFGRRPSDSEMATNANILARFHKLGRTWDNLAVVVEGLALRRDRGELRSVPRNKPVSLKWLNDGDQSLNQLAVSEDAYFRGDVPAQAAKRGGVVPISTVLQGAQMGERRR